MTQGKKLLLLLLLAAAAVGAGASASQHGQNRPTPEARKFEEDFYTETTPDAPEPSDPEKRRLRKLRRDRYKVKPYPSGDPAWFEITEEKGGGLNNLGFHAPTEPAIPAAQSDAVVVGQVTDAEAYLSTEKTGVFSEFTVSLADVLKADAAWSLAPGVSVGVVRSGGGVRFPSGKVVRQGTNGKPLPRVGRTYLFFLKRNEVGEDFTIITAYELRDGRVYPLDGTNIDGGPAIALDAYLKFSGADEATFMATVREALAAAAANPPENGDE